MGFGRAIYSSLISSALDSTDRFNTVPGMYVVEYGDDYQEEYMMRISCSLEMVHMHRKNGLPLLRGDRGPTFRCRSPMFVEPGANGGGAGCDGALFN